MLPRYSDMPKAAADLQEQPKSSHQGSLLDLMGDAPGALRQTGDKVVAFTPNKGFDNSGSLLNSIGIAEEHDIQQQNLAELAKQKSVVGPNLLHESSTAGLEPASTNSAEYQLNFLEGELDALKQRMVQSRGPSATEASPQSNQSEKPAPRELLRAIPKSIGSSGLADAPNQYHYRPVSTNPFTFDKTISVVLRSWKSIAVFAFLGFMASVIFALSLPNKFQSIAEILIEPRELKVLDNSVRPNGLNSEATVAYAESQVRIITSSSVIDPVIEEMELTEDSEFTGDIQSNGTVARLVDLFFKSASTRSDKVSAAKKYLYDNLFVSRINQTFLIQLGITTTDPAKSARIANAIANSYMSDESGARSSSARSASTELASRLDGLRAQVRSSEENVEQYKAENGLVDADGKLVSEVQLSRLSEQLTLAQVQSGDARTRAKLAAEVDLGDVISGSLPTALVTPNVSLLRLEYAKAKARLEKLATKLGARHPDRIAAQAEQQSALTAIGREIKRIVQTAQEDFKRARAREVDLTAKVNELKATAVTDSAAKVKLRELNREVEANRSIYEAFLLRSRETSEQENIRSNSARLVSEAVPAAQKIGPNRKLIVAIGTAIGAALGGVVGLFPFLIGGLRQVANGVQQPRVRQEHSSGSQWNSTATGGDLYSSDENRVPQSAPSQIEPQSNNPGQTQQHPQPMSQAMPQPTPVYGNQMPLPGLAPQTIMQPGVQPVYMQPMPTYATQQVVQPVQTAAPHMIYTAWAPPEQK